MGFVANFICFAVVHQLRFEKVIESLKMRTFLRHSVVSAVLLKSQHVSYKTDSPELSPLFLLGVML